MIIKRWGCQSILQIDGGLSLTLKAGGQHIVLNPGGIWMTMPVWTGGVPMEGTLAAPLLPINSTKSVKATTAPPVKNIGVALASGTPFIQVCQKPRGGTPAACPLTHCPCRAKLMKGEV